MMELTFRDDVANFSSSQLEMWLFRYACIAEQKGIQWAKDKALFESLDDKKKVVLADSSPIAGSEASKEREAHKSETYKAYLDGLKEARFNSNKSWVEYSSAKDKFEALRSILSNRREEVKRML